MNRYNAATGHREHLPEPEHGMPTHDGQTISSASQSSRLGSRESNPIDFPATCAAENLPEARQMPRPRADQGGQSLPRWSASIPSFAKEHGSLAEKPPRPKSGRGGDLNAILNRLSPQHLEQEDLILMLILFLLWRESGDRELLIALGAFLFL